MAHSEARWRRLIALLEPIHGQAAATARRLCRSTADGDDLYQEAVLRAFDKLDTLRDESRFRSWFYATLLNRHRDRTRQSFWKRFVPWDEAFSDGREPSSEPDTSEVEHVGQTGRVARALSALPAVQREAVVLFEIENFSIEEIAIMQGASVPAVKSRLVRGRQRLRRWYERHGWSTRAAATDIALPLSAKRDATTSGMGPEPLEAVAWSASSTSGKEPSDV